MKRKNSFASRVFCWLFALALLARIYSAHAQGTAFSYQGHLLDGGTPANGSYDLTFSLFDGDVAGNQIGNTLTKAAVDVANGLFTVTLDFDAGAFDGSPRWLEISVSPNGANNFQALSPLQEITPTPYAIYAATAGTATSANSVSAGAVASDQLLTLAPPLDGQLLGYAGGSLSWIDPGVAAGSIWSLSLNGTDTYYTAGAVGIGTNSPEPGIALDVHGAELLTLGGSGGNIQFGTPAAQTGMTIIGVNRADLRFDGSSFQLVANAGRGIPPAANGIAVDTAGNVNVGRAINFGSTTRQMFNMFGTGFGAGVQTSDLYFRSGGGFAFHVGGVHNDATYNSGGGTTVATLDLTTGLDFGSRLGQQLTLWGGVSTRRFCIGVQDSTLYSRCGDGGADGFVWYKGGVFDSRFHNGGGGQLLATLDSNGLFISGPANVCTLTIRGGCDLAEPFPMKDTEIQKGSVVVIDGEHPGQLKLSTQAYDTHVAGIISGANGINPGISLNQEGISDGGQNVALSGRVYVQADATAGAINPGDLLTTSETPGCAMKVTDHTKAQGAILGKAMGSLKTGKGMVLVLVTLQ